MQSIRTPRAAALDALRGFAILTMILSGVIPYKILPAWMYHAQLPPPTHQFNPALPGLTWVDLVFPLFLFALGAAIPLALGSKLERLPVWKIILGILERGFLMGFFAIFLRHVRPHVLNPTPQTREWLLALLGLALLFLIYTRLPQSLKRWQNLTLRISGWMGAGLLLWQLKYPDGTGFSLHRSDIILIVLTNVAVFGSLIWLATRRQMRLRLGLLGILIGFRLVHPEAGWVHWLWNFSPAPWIYQLYYLQYLFIVIPGTIIGDFLVEWQSTRAVNPALPAVRIKINTQALLLPVIVLLLLVGLQTRWLVGTTILALALGVAGLCLVCQPRTDTDKFLQTLFHWGFYWLVLGLIFEPFEGGIKKDHPTLSYYFVTTGLSIFILQMFFILIDLFRKPWFNLLVLNGQNPMLAYVGFANFIWPVLALTGLEPVILRWTTAPWSGFLRGLAYTLILGWLTAFITQRKIFWRT